MDMGPQFKGSFLVHEFEAMFFFVAKNQKIPKFLGDPRISKHQKFVQILGVEENLGMLDKSCEQGPKMDGRPVEGNILKFEQILQIYKYINIYIYMAFH